jgi:hypothetical protein
MVLMRDPWGTVAYTGPYNKSDASWTDAALAASPLPFGLDPRTAWSDGLFVMEKTQFFDATCLSDAVQIAHYRDNSGYKRYWYAAVNMDETAHTYTITVPTTLNTQGAFYFTASTYYWNVVPSSCTTGPFADLITGAPAGTTTSPAVYYKLYQQGQSAAWNYADSTAPTYLLITDYQPGDVFTLTVQWAWVNSPAKDYTVGIYTSVAGVTVLDNLGMSSMLNMDGTLPSGLTKPSSPTPTPTTGTPESPGKECTKPSDCSAVAKSCCALWRDTGAAKTLRKTC